MTAAAIHYTSTEKKRIRKSFAKRASVLKVPFLLATQLDSYTAFLQADDAARDSARTKACRRRSRRFSRSRAIRGNARLEFVELRAAASPPFDVKECQQRGLTFASPVARQGAPDHHGQGSAPSRRSRK